MKATFFIGLLFTVCSFTCSNSNAMDKVLKNINTLVSGDKINKTEVEIALGIKLAEDKKASATQGMHIYELGLNNPFSEYARIELRIFNGDSRFFLIVYPDRPVPLNLEALKKEFTYKDFTSANSSRKEPAGYHFEKNGNRISFYCDEQLRNIIHIAIEGAIK